jgi:transcriptional regulator with XRE-family HTH domain
MRSSMSTPMTFNAPDRWRDPTRAGADVVAMPKKSPASEVDRMAGLRLRAVREAWDPAGVIKQATFAAKLGIERTALANWEAGKLPDVRAMVRLHAWLGIPLEWIYLGEYRHVEYDLADRLIAAAADLGAAVAGPTVEYPMAIERRPGLAGMRAAGHISVRPRRSSLHEPRAPEDP